MSPAISTVIATPNQKLASTFERQISAFPNVNIQSLTCQSELKRIENHMDHYQLVFLDHNWFENLKYVVESSQSTKGYVLRLNSNQQLSQNIALSQNFDWLPFPADLARLGKIIYKPNSHETQPDPFLKKSPVGFNTGFSQKLTLFSTEGFRRISTSDIIRCKAEGNYTRFFFNDGSTFLLSKNLKEIEKTLAGYGFFRCHQSHLIRLDSVTGYRKTGSWIHLNGGDKVELARSKKPLFMKIMCAEC